jgi:hypothetical protein
MGTIGHKNLPGSSFQATEQVQQELRAGLHSTRQQWYMQDMFDVSSETNHIFNYLKWYSNTNIVGTLATLLETDGGGGSLDSVHHSCHNEQVLPLNGLGLLAAHFTTSN